MSEVLRLCCSIENEIGRNAMKNFASLLEKAFQEYHNLLDAYLELLPQQDDNKVKSPFSFIQLQPHDIKDNTSLLFGKLGDAPNVAAKQVFNAAIQTSLDARKVSTLAVERGTSTSKSNHEVDDTFLDCSESVEEETSFDGLLKSPVLGQNNSSFKKTSVVPHRIILESTSDCNTPTPVITNAHSSKNNSPEDSTTTSTKIENRDLICTQNCDNNDEIACTPISKVPKRLGVSKLYNVGTTLLSNGKKLRQSKLVFHPTEQEASVVHKKKYKSPLKPDTSPILEKNIKRNLEDSGGDKQIDEEIIESSPKRAKSNLRMKTSMKVKDNNSKQSVDQSSDTENCRSYSRSSNIKRCDSKSHTPLIKGEKFSSNQQLQTEENEPYLIKKSGIVYVNPHVSPKNDGDISVASQSPVFDIEHFSFDQVIENLDVSKNELQMQKKKLSKSIDDSQIFNDETFFAMGKENKDQNTDKTQNSECKYKILIKPPSPNTSLMCSFDMVPEKKETNFKSKSKAERAKLNGISCWECKQYYEKLGLSEEEIRARQKQCSRHRTRYRERESTPKGFWDPLFNDTLSSTFQDG